MEKNKLGVDGKEETLKLPHTYHGGKGREGKNGFAIHMLTQYGELHPPPPSTLGVLRI